MRGRGFEKLCLGWGQVKDCCEYGNRLQGSIKDEEFYSQLEEEPAPWIWLFFCLRHFTDIVVNGKPVCTPGFNVQNVIYFKVNPILCVVWL
jgi:hypothetical protein